MEEGRERLRLEAEAARRERLLEEKEALEGRFLSGADCKWTSIGGSKALYIRKNGRACRRSSPVLIVQTVSGALGLGRMGQLIAEIAEPTRRINEDMGVTTPLRRRVCDEHVQVKQ